MMMDVSGVEADCIRVEKIEDFGEEVVWEDIVRGRSMEVVGD